MLVLDAVRVLLGTNLCPFCPLVILMVMGSVTERVKEIKERKVILGSYEFLTKTKRLTKS